MKPYTKRLLIGCLLVFPMASAGYGQDVQGDKATIQSLLVEVRQLRMALERSAYIAPRMQVAFARVQTQQDRVDRLSKELRDHRSRMAGTAAEKDQAAGTLKKLDESPWTADPAQKKDFEASLKARFADLDQRLTVERGQEVELLGLLQTEQTRLNEVSDQLTTLEKQLQPQ